MALFLLSVHPDLRGQEIRQNKNVLVLFAMTPSTPAYRVFSEGIRNSLNQHYGDGFNLHVEYLETERFPQGEYPPERFELINEKYENIGLDLLICIGINLIGTVREHADAHLLNLPAISIDYDFSSFGFPDDISVNRKTAIIHFNVDADKIISSALSVFPETESIYFICGVSAMDKIMYSIAKEAIVSSGEKRHFTFLTDISMDEVLKTVSHLPAKSIIIIPNFNVDSKQVPYYNPESARLISRSANVPVFTFTDMGFGEGPVGGYLLSYRKTSRIIGETAIKILNGADPNSFHFSESDYYEYMFDWRMLKRWGLAGSDRIPEDSTIHFEEVSFIDRYKYIIIAGGAFLLVQTIMIFLLIRMNNKQKRITSELIETKNRFQDIVREERVLRIGQLTASLSHELNQPLTAILSTAQAGLKFIESGNHTPEIMREILQNIVEDDKRTAAVLSSIRGMLKLETREKEIVDLNELIWELVAIYRSEAINQSIRLNIRLQDGPVLVFADPIQVQQVLMNFMTNAAQAMANLESKVIDVTQYLENDFVTVSIRDYGTGIPENIRERLFKPFVTGRKDGFGIGLAISKSIIDAHQGVIKAENNPDGGAVFSFSLKMHKNA